MINSDSLWVGDHVRLIKSDRRGIYEGTNDEGKAKVRIDDKIIISAFANIEIAPPPVKKKVDLSTEESSTSSILTFTNTIDLHIDVLAPELENQLPEAIFNKQIKECTSFVEKAINQRIKYITIIHGIGKGQLKKEVHHILNGYDQVRLLELIHNGGATYVSLTYQ